jgi:hypothetical protein
VGYLTSDSHFIVSLATLPVAGVLLIVRCFGVRICLTTVTKVAAPRSQFSIRQLLILTFAVANPMSLGKWLEPHLLPVTNPFLLASCGYRLVRLSIDTNETVRNEAVRYLKLRTEKSQGAEAEEPRS